VRDAHVAVVDRHGEVVERAAVRPLDHEVLDRRVGVRHVAEHGVLERDLTLLRHAEAHGALVLVGVAVVEQLPHRRRVRVAPLPLRQRALVPIELEPAERVEDQLDVLGCGALAVGVLDPEHELAARTAREEPVVKCRPRAADVQHAGWRRREPYPHRQRC
jgi:hypothetical protein